jgi:hypothetical protein
MNGHRFDHAARALAAMTSRRRLLRGILGGGVGALAATRLGTPRRAAAQSTTAGIAEVINKYRAEQGLAPIPVSDELTQVAKAHIADLAANHPEDACNGNLHSWSDNGNWTGGCYDPNDDTTWPLMWDKPRELTAYPGDGFEVSAWADPAISAEQALALWVGSPPHRDVLLNNGIWADFPWGAIGGWAENGYACAWFGKEAGTPPVGGGEPEPEPDPGGTTICPWGPQQCKQGYVWRVSTPEDLVCVTPEVREQTAIDNAEAEERKDPACATEECEYGPDTCLPGYVWRVITPDDLVCVTPETRAQVEDDNANAEDRIDPACAEVPAPDLDEDEIEDDPEAGAPPDEAVEAEDGEPPDNAETGPAPDAPSGAGEDSDDEEESEDSEDSEDSDGFGDSDDSETERPDSDEDGLYDDDETDVYFTDPEDEDSDGDGYTDGEEVFYDTDPTDTDDYPTE